MGSPSLAKESESVVVVVVFDAAFPELELPALNLRATVPPPAVEGVGSYAGGDIDTPLND